VQFLCASAGLPEGPANVAEGTSPV